jgi:hypothetical protein
MAGEWLNALMQSPNAGETFIKSYQHAQDRKEQQAIRQQQMQEHQQDRQMQVHKFENEQQQQKWEVIGRAAAQADTPEKWDQVVDQLSASGFPEAAQYRGKFSPGLRAAFMAQGGIDPQKAGNAPTSYEEYQRARQDPNYGKFLEERRGPIVTHNDDGTITLIPRNMLPGAPPQEGGNIPSVTDEASYNAIPPGTQYRTPDGHVRVKQGGPAGNQPGGFR